MATATVRGENFHSSTNGNRQEYVCDCGRKCASQTELNEHQTNNCRKRELQCTFCQEPQPSSKDLSEHLMLCGNKTDQCPNCQKFIRRAIFAYHYENNCANLDEPDAPAQPTRISSAHRPSSSNASKSASKTNNFIDNDQENKSDSSIINDSSDKSHRILSATPKNKNPNDIKECRYCKQKCLRSDYDTHKKNCLQNPKKLNKDQQRTTSTSTKPEVTRPLTNEGQRSNDIVKIPCDLCNEEIDLNLWTTHSEDCKRRENRRIEARAKAINEESVIEKLPCEHCKELFLSYLLRRHEEACLKNPENIALLTRPPITQPTTATLGLFNGLTNTVRDQSLSSTYSSLTSSHASVYKPARETADMLDELHDRKNDATQRNERFSSHLNVDVKSTEESSRLRDRDRSSLGISGYDVPRGHGATDHSGSHLMNSSNDVPAYGTSSLLTGHRPLSGMQSLGHRSGRTTSMDRSSIIARTDEYLNRPRRAPSPSVCPLHSSDVSRIPRNDRGSLSAASSRANRPLSSAGNILFDSSHGADSEYRPLINERGHSARDRTTSKSKPPFVQPPMRFSMAKHTWL